MYNPNDPQRKLRRPQPSTTTTGTAQGPVPLAGPLTTPPALEVPSVQERMTRQGATPSLTGMPSVMQAGAAMQPGMQPPPRTDIPRPSPPSTDPIAQARQEYIMRGVEGRDILGDELAAPRRNWKDTLKTAGIGALQGLATGGLGGAIGGALAGTAVGLISPRAARGYQFEMMQRPRMEEDLQRQMALRKAQEEFETRNVQQAYTGAMTEDLLSKAEERREGLPLTRRRQMAETERLERQRDLYEAQKQRLENPAAPRVTPDLIRTVDPKTGREIQRYVDPMAALQSGQTFPVARRPASGSEGEGKIPASAKSQYDQFLEAQSRAKDLGEIYNQALAKSQAGQNAPSAPGAKNAPGLRNADLKDDEALTAVFREYQDALMDLRRKAAGLKQYSQYFKVFHADEPMRFNEQTQGFAMPWPYVEPTGR